jgi:hypothetical protein
LLVTVQIIAMLMPPKAADSVCRVLAQCALPVYHRAGRLSRSSWTGENPHNPRRFSGPRANWPQGSA